MKTKPPIPYGIALDNPGAPSSVFEGRSWSRFPSNEVRATGVPRMTRSIKISLVGIGIIAMLVIVCWYALFQGYFDHGQFEIKQSQRSSSNEVAMIGERSDHDALGGLEYYVLIGDHLFNSAELRRAYYSKAVAFNAASDCLTIRWDGPGRLIIRCNGSNIDKNHINAQRQQIGNVSIAYENIAIK